MQDIDPKMGVVRNSRDFPDEARKWWIGYRQQRKPSQKMSFNIVGNP
ncbi:MAG: hypothetical protein QM690_04680 [Sphingobium sp.]